jgi:hypothetical protein
MKLDYSSAVHAAAWNLARFSNVHFTRRVVR